MGRRNHLMRIALSASQPQIQEPVTPSESDDGMDEDEIAAASKHEKIQRIDIAQEAILSAIGFMSEEERLKRGPDRNKDTFSMSTLCGLINYHSQLPLSSQRNQILVPTIRPILV
jgi:hypothetical protein